MDIDIQQLSELLTGGKWAPLGALVIFSIVRLLKSDVALPSWLPPVPPKYRPWLALALGAVACFLAKLGAGAGWQASLAFGASSTLGALLTHVVLIEKIRKDVDVPIPAAMRRGPDRGTP